MQFEKCCFQKCLKQIFWLFRPECDVKMFFEQAKIRDLTVKKNVHQIQLFIKIFGFFLRDIKLIILLITSNFLK